MDKKQSSWVDPKIKAVNALISLYKDMEIVGIE
jgi:hypothetical protein